MGFLPGWVIGFPTQRGRNSGAVCNLLMRSRARITGAPPTPNLVSGDSGIRGFIWGQCKFFLVPTLCGRLDRHGLTQETIYCPQISHQITLIAAGPAPRGHWTPAAKPALWTIPVTHAVRYQTRENQVPTLCATAGRSLRSAQCATCAARHEESRSRNLVRTKSFELFRLQ